MNDNIIEEYKKNIAFLQMHNLNVGSKIKVKHYGSIREETITWINPHYFWFGSENGWILRRDVIFNEGEVAHEKIGSD